ncbi:MAG TPA: hypothetical protein VF613_03375 [Longimicrobium sp.]|jgi:hypothetical protein
MRSFLCAVLPLVLAACAQGVATSQAGGDLTLENRTGRAVMYHAIELEASHLMDPAPEWRVGDRPERLVPAGGRREVQVEGYKRGDGVRLFIYVVDAAAEKATLARTLTVSGEELRRTGYRVVVEKL